MEYAALFILILILMLLLTTRLIYGIYIFLVLVPIAGLYLTEVAGITIQLSQYMGMLCIIVFIWNVLVRIQHRMFIPSLVIPLIVFGGVNIFLLLVNFSKVVTFGVITDFNSPGWRSIKVVIWCIFSILMTCTVNYSIKNKRDLKNCLSVVLLTTMVICALSLVAYVTVLLKAPFAALLLTSRRGGFLGINGTFLEPGYFANYLSSIVPLAFFIFIFRIYKLGLIFSFLSCFILLITNFLAFSTTGLAGLLLTVTLVPFFIARYRLGAVDRTIRYVVVLLLCIYIVSLIAVGLNIDMVKGIALNFFEKIVMKEHRWAARLMGWRMFCDYPIAGVGPGNWAWYMTQGYAQEIEQRTMLEPAGLNLYFEILVDLGIVGFIPFAWFFINLFRKLSRGIYKTKDLFLKTVLAGYFLGFIIQLAVYFVNFNFYRTHVWAFLGMAMAAIRLARNEEAAP
jgi:O-antigen ligase